jgi:phospholipase C
MRRAVLAVSMIVAVAALVAAVGATTGSSKSRRPAASGRLNEIKHFVVIYEENHSFDNLYGYWEGVNGLPNADFAHTLQVGQNGALLTCLPQLDVNLTSPPLPSICTTPGGTPSHFANSPFLIDPLIPPTASTCPAPGAFSANGFANGTALPGGCTRDIVHRYYQEQFQIDQGRQDRYAQGSDAAGLVMGVYDTHALPIYAYLHSKGHPGYAIADEFSQSAFGGSFLNHQLLVAATAPVWKNAVNDGGPNDLHSVVDANGMPNNYTLYVSPLGAQVKDQQITASCSPGPGRAASPAGITCGDFAVNTTQPTYQPFAPGTASTRQLPPLTNPTIGDELSGAKVDWAWYSGGWSNADGDIGAPGWTNGTSSCTDPNVLKTAVFPNCPDADFQFHHQAFNYYAAFDPSTPAGKANRKAHLQDEVAFQQLAAASDTSCKLKQVSFVKPIGEENEHPGYASESAGSNHLVDLLKSIEGSACAKDTMVIVTYDEFGGQWDHVSPPGQGLNAIAGPHDQWGPGTRIPALVLAPGLKGPFVVDHTEHDTISILSTLEHRFGLKALSKRDAADNDLSSVWGAAPVTTG